MDFNIRILFLAHPRSGSSSLYEVLQSHPNVNILEEPFNENFTRWNPVNKNYLALIRDIPSLDEQAAEIFESHNGIKFLDYQLPADLIAHLLRRADCKIIFLRRRNLLQLVVSVLIAEQTQLWKKWEMTKPLEEYYRNLPPLDIADIRQRVSEMKRRLDFSSPSWTNAQTVTRSNWRTKNSTVPRRRATESASPPSGNFLALCLLA